MKHLNLARTLVLVLSIIFVQFSMAEEDDFNLERLPLGNQATKYSFGAVKLNQIYESGKNRHLAESDFFAAIKASSLCSGVSTLSVGIERYETILGGSNSPNRKRARNTLISARSRSETFISFFLIALIKAC